MTNPFEILSVQLERIETMLVDLHKQHQAKKTTSTEQPQYLTVTEAARFLGVSNGTIYRHVMTGALPKRKFGNKLYFPKSVLEGLLEKPSKG